MLLLKNELRKQSVSLLNSFPKELPQPRPQQIEVLDFLDEAFKRSNIIIVESPVGSGKSGVAMAVSRHFGGGIVVTPRIALQRQYCDEFERTAPLMGRANFSCLQNSETAYKTIPIIKAGQHPPKPILEHSCAAAPCLSKPIAKQKKIKAACEELGGCPHQHSIDKAQETETVVANFHSLMYCVSLNERITRRKVIVFDECHNLANQLRDFLKVKFKIRRQVFDSEVKHLKTTEQWCQFLMLPEQRALLRDQDQVDSWKARLEKLLKCGNTVQNSWKEPETDFLFVEFVPTNIGSAAQSMLFSLAEKIVFMSGTIYGKDTFLKPLGFESDEIPYLKVASDFPAENRKVFLPKVDARDLSFKGWKANFGWMIEEIKAILAKYPNQKGLIHVNSYRVSKEVALALADTRIVCHNSETFADDLKQFYATDEPKVFLSPTISEGYSFDDDEARFQIILTPKFDPASDAYVKYLLDNNRWDLYNYEALKVLGQQFGRPVRSKTDYADTYLIGSGFNSLLKKSWKQIPQWQREGFRNG